jgi:hypothetical protein
MDANDYLRAGFIVLGALVFGTLEMKRRAAVTEEVARRWLEEGGYRVADHERLTINAWVNPAGLAVRAADSSGNPVDLALTVKWLMGGVLGKGEVKCVARKSAGDGA